MQKDKTNKLLLRQIRRNLGDDVEFPKEFEKLLLAVNDSYNHFERDRKLIERAMEKSSEELRASFEKLIIQNELKRRNKELQQFVSIASHDLKAPLRTINSFAQLLKRELGSNISKNAQEYLDFIMNGARGMDTLIKGLLDHAKASNQSSNIEKVDINDVLKIVNRNCFAIIQENDASIVIKKQMPIVFGDGLQLVQLFQNFINNAIKFQKENNKAIVTIDYVLKEDHYIFSISDNGIGIPKSYQEKVFNVFERLENRNQYEGTGLGLSICKKIIDTLGGEIWLESEVNVGTTFFFSIPVKQSNIPEDQVIEVFVNEF